MKKTLLSVLLLSSICSQAEPLWKKQVHQQQLPYPYNLPEEVILQQQSKHAYKSTAVQKRLISRAYNSNSERLDSTHFVYNNPSRGSDHRDFNSYYSSYALTAGDQIHHIKCDTIKRWANDGGGTLDLRSTTTYKYNNKNTAIESEDRYEYGIFQAVGKYNSSDQLIQLTQIDTFGTGTLTPKREMYILYDGQGRRIMDSSINLLTNEYNYRRTYHYDANGNLDSFLSYQNLTGGWELSYSTATTYDASNRVIVKVAFGDFGMGFMGIGRDSFSYTGTATHPSYHTTFTWDDFNGSWQPHEQLEYTLNSKQLPESYLVYRYDNKWDTLERDVYKYNDEDLLMQSNGYLYLGDGQFSTMPYDQSSLYYEAHDPSGVNDLSNNHAKQLDIFPNPSSSIVNIPTAGKAGRISVANINGQELYNSHVQGSMTIIDVSNWTSGNYFFILKSEDESATYTATFTKQ